MIGVDEVGRGSWAGPLLVVAAKPYANLPTKLRDSKLLSAKQRQEILDLLSICCSFSEGWVTPAEIDRLGLASALNLGVKRALSRLKPADDEQIILDGNVNYTPKKYKNSQCIIDADESIPVVSAASIYAKVTRDSVMANLKFKFPNYGFERHVGYGTVFHKNAIAKYGVISGIHRLSFKPVGALAS